MTEGNKKLNCIVMKKFEERQYSKKTIQFKNSK